MNKSVLGLFFVAISLTVLCFSAYVFYRQITGQNVVKEEEVVWLPGVLAKKDTIWEKSSKGRKSYMKNFKFKLEGVGPSFTFTTYSFSSFNVGWERYAWEYIPLGDSLSFQIYKEDAEGLDKARSLFDKGVAISGIKDKNGRVIFDYEDVNLSNYFSTGFILFASAVGFFIALGFLASGLAMFGEKSKTVPKQAKANSDNKEPPLSGESAPT